MRRVFSRIIAAVAFVLCAHAPGAGSDDVLIQGRLRPVKDAPYERFRISGRELHLLKDGREPCVYTLREFLEKPRAVVRSAVFLGDKTSCAGAAGEQVYGHLNFDRPDAAGEMQLLSHREVRAVLRVEAVSR